MVIEKVVIVIRWYAQDEVNQQDSEQNEVDGMTEWRRELIPQIRWCKSKRVVGDL